MADSVTWQIIDKLFPTRTLYLYENDGQINKKPNRSKVRCWRMTSMKKQMRRKSDDVRRIFAAMFSMKIIKLTQKRFILSPELQYL